MKKLLFISAITLFGLSNPVSAQVSNNNIDGVYKIDKHAQQYREGEIIVKLKSTSSAKAKARNGVVSTGVSALDKALAAIGASEAEELMPLTGSQNIGKRVKAYNGNTVVSRNMSKLYLMSFDTQKVNSVEQAIEAVKAIDDVEYAEPNYIYYVSGCPVPDDETSSIGTITSSFNDPLLASQWGISTANVAPLWEKSRVKSARTVISIIDTGVDITHPDLKDNIWTNSLEANGSTGSDDDGNGYKDDIHGWNFINSKPASYDGNGHGTHCAGIAAAVGNNGIGIVGANPDALIMPIKVLSDAGLGFTSTIIKGIDYAVANGANVISMSLGGYGYSSAYEQACENASANGVIVVGAAGNDTRCLYSHACPNNNLRVGAPSFPGAFKSVVGVEASAQNGSRASYSNFDEDGPTYSASGESSWYNYELRAPGSNVLSTYPGGKYVHLSGTSMATPLVAGIISRLLDLKSYSNNDVLISDLISSRGEDLGDIDALAAYNINAKRRAPKLSVMSYTLTDNGDGDGKADAGETISIYPTLINTNGTASNIKVSLELKNSSDASYVTFVNTSVNLDKSLETNEKLTSTEPLQFKVSDDCSDGYTLNFVIKATCDDAESVASQNVAVPVESCTELGGMLTSNMTLYPNVHYVITSTLAIPSGVTLTIKPGTTIKFKDNTGFACSGTLNAVGEPGNMITFTKADGCTGSQYNAFKSSSTIKYAVIKDLNFSSANTMSCFTAPLENCILENVTLNNFRDEDMKFTKCNIIGLYTSGLWHKLNDNIDTYSNFNYDNFIGNYFSFTATNRYHNNITWYKGCNMYGNYKGYKGSTSRPFNLMYYSEYACVYTQGTPNYMGSSVESKVRESLYDMYNANMTGYGYVDLSNMATQPTSEAHGLVWKVCVNSKDAQDEYDQITPLGIGTHKFEVYFNRAMNTNIKPSVTMGTASPYDAVAIGENGSWSSDGKIYTTYLTINGKNVSDGTYRIDVKDAEDNEYFPIPEENYRFNVPVSISGSLATDLLAEAGLGKVDLTWKTAAEDYEDLMGYKVYRYTVDNGTKSTVSQVNDGIISAEETSFTDYNVTPGITYYYYVTETSTDFSENDISNVVVATPLTAEKGDANGSMAVDVMDVVSEISYMSGGDPQPFVFDAADVNSDTKINILDVVGTVNIIKANAASEAKANVTAGISESIAKFTIEDGILYVDCDQPLGGLQFMVNAPQGTEQTAMDGVEGMEQSSTWMNDNQCLYIAFSMSGNVIPAGKNAILKIGDTDVNDMIISSTKGDNIVAVNGTATSIQTLPYGLENSENVISRIYDITGRQVNAKSLKTGVYIMNIYAGGKIVKSYKFMQK